MKKSRTTTMLAGAFVAACGGGGNGGTGVMVSEVSIEPPENLELDGRTVSAGNFVVMEARAYGRRRSPDCSTCRSNFYESQLVVVDEVLRRISHRVNPVEPLFQTSPDTEILRMKGYFEATEPSLDPAEFDVTIFGDFSRDYDVTVYLPESTDDFAAQVSILDDSDGFSRDDPTDIFVDADFTSADLTDIASSTGTGGQLDESDVPAPRSSTPMTRHGSLAGRTITLGARGNEGAGGSGGEGGESGFGGSGGNGGSGGSGGSSGSGGSGGSSSSGEICSPQSIVPGCSIRFCADQNGNRCRYEVNGRSFNCGSCTNVTSCAMSAANACL